MDLKNPFQRPLKHQSGEFDKSISLPDAAGHMTWAKQTMGTTVHRTRDFLSRRLWAWPIIALVLLLGVGWGVHGAIERTMNENLRSQLQTLLDVEVAMLRTWLAGHENNAESVAGDAEIRQLTGQLVQATKKPIAESGDPLELNRQLGEALGPAMQSHDYDSFFVANRDLNVIAATYPDALGSRCPATEHANCANVLEGSTAVSRPFSSQLALSDGTGNRRSDIPVMYVLSPIRDKNLQVTAILGLQIRPDREFTRILQLGRLGESGETYALGPDGKLLSNSRFDEDLVLLGILPDQPDVLSILHLEVRDPGDDLTTGYRAAVRRAEMPLTRMAASAVSGKSETDVTGYRDYRGVTVVGAWKWLDEYNFGVATEVDYAEAFRPLTILKRTFWGLLALLTLSSVAIFVFTLLVARLQQQARKAAIEAKQLGQYELEKKIGEGAMGVVYQGRHAMLRRPTAIKLLNADRVTEQAIASFEREVQITSQLEHPNTIAIYDYGRTPEDVFYYAMEFLDGIDLQELVDRYGPLPPGRAIYILQQICGSLYEAHSAGLVHRDIKPANIMLNRRGGEGDVVKVLDFGLVKAKEESGKDSKKNAMAGTPLYLSPEGIQAPDSVDACSDLYAVGATGYFLLTGQPPFDSDTLNELCRQHISEAPVPPSVRLGQELPEELENAILACLEKQRSQRPQTARELAEMLDRCPAADEWSLAQADAWWGRFNRGQLTVEKPSLLSGDAPAESQTSQSTDHDMTIEHMNPE